MKKNKAMYKNRYGDIITFEHKKNKVRMKGGRWFRYGHPNNYSEAYAKYVISAIQDANLPTNQILTRKEFEDNIWRTQDGSQYGVLSKVFGKYVYSDKSIIDMVDPSGGPYISLQTNLNEFWPKDTKEDLIVEKIELETVSSKKDMKGKKCKECTDGRYRKGFPGPDNEELLRCDKCEDITPRDVDEREIEVVFTIQEDKKTKDSRKRLKDKRERGITITTVKRQGETQGE